MLVHKSDIINNDDLCMFDNLLIVASIYRYKYISIWQDHMTIVYVFDCFNMYMSACVCVRMCVCVCAFVCVCVYVRVFVYERYYVFVVLCVII